MKGDDAWLSLKSRIVVRGCSLREGVFVMGGEKCAVSKFVHDEDRWWMMHYFNSTGFTNLMSHNMLYSLLKMYCGYDS